MGFRETLNENRIALVAFTVLPIVLCGVLYLKFHTRAVPPQRPTTAYFSDDDGKTWFIESMTRVPPFDHNGKEAVHVVLYRCAGKTFVARLEKYTPETKARLEQAAQAGNLPVPSGRRVETGLMMKKPGEAQWHEIKSEDYVNGTFAELTRVVCPDGSSDLPELVRPDQSPNP